MKAKNILISFVLLLLVAAGVYFFLNSKSNEEQKQQEVGETPVEVSDVKPEEKKSIVISNFIQRWDSDIPFTASPIQDEMDWIVYLEETEETDCYIACKLYLENAISHDKYLLLETKGEAQQGTKLSIRARNQLAYGCDEIGYEDEASYKEGYIQAVENVKVVSPTKLLLMGYPDCRNMYAYLLDLETYSAIHIEAYSGFGGIMYEDGVPYMDFYTPDYSAGYRQEYQERYDLSGTLISRSPYIEE